MDTRGKTNVEFRNDVGEILARQESNFDQVHSILQTVLTIAQTITILKLTHLAGKNPHTHVLLTPTQPTTPIINTSSYPFQSSMAKTQLVGSTKLSNILTLKK